MAGHVDDPSRPARGQLFNLVQKEGSEAFTSEDEDLLALFASQAATAIVNARTHKAEQRARTDLEVLVETSPVGVVVIDAPNRQFEVTQSRGKAGCGKPS